MRILSALLAAVFAAALWISSAGAVELTKEDEAAIQNQVVAVLTEFNNGNLDALLDVMPPSAIALFGGRDQLKTIVAGALQSQKAQNTVFESMTPGKISKPFMAGTTVICFVPTESVMKVNDKRVRGTGFMIASRAQGESQWRLLGGDGLAKAPQILGVIFPGAPEKVDMPPIKYEVLP